MIYNRTIRCHSDEDGFRFESQGFLPLARLLGIDLYIKKINILNFLLCDNVPIKRRYTSNI